MCMQVYIVTVRMLPDKYVEGPTSNKLNRRERESVEDLVPLMNGFMEAA